MVKHALTTFFLSFFAIILMFLMYVALPSYLVDKYSKNSRSIINYVSFYGSIPRPSPTPLPTPGLEPATLLIPKLKIQAAIEHVGLTETNNMEVPKNTANVAWYMYGKKPGETGNSVIAGHFDTPSGRPAIFYHLRSLEVGDEIEVISENALRNTFVVTEKATIPYDTFPSEEVFKTRDGNNLNLITCGGIWDTKKHTYTDRIVVYTRLKEGFEGI